MKNDCAPQPDNSASIDALTNAGVIAARSAIESVGEVVRLAVALNPVLNALTERRSSCHIPPPCWLPKELGELRSLACPGGTASVRVRVTNCQPVSGRVEVAGKSELSVKVTPSEATLGPMEREWFNAAISLPADVCAGQKFEVLLWVLGCNSHYLRWTVEVADQVSTSCHSVEVDDCPDYVHHWYDHFYCQRPCFNSGRQKERESG